MKEFYLLKKVRRTSCYIRSQIEDQIKEYIEWKQLGISAHNARLWGPEAEAMKKRYKRELDDSTTIIKTFFKENAIEMFVDMLMRELEMLEDVKELETPNR